MQSLAAEVVALEEKVLQVRSREIRLESHSSRLQEGLEASQKKLHTTAHDRDSLQHTIGILQVLFAWSNVFHMLPSLSHVHHDMCLC